MPTMTIPGELDRDATLEVPAPIAELIERVSHELRTPLGAILMWLDVLRIGSAAQREKAVDAIERSARTQLRLLEDLLDVTRAERGALRLSFESIDVQTPLQAAVTAVEPSARAKGVELNAFFCEQPGAQPGDALRLERAFYSVIEAAIDCAAPGGSVGIRFERANEGVRVRIEDSGQGFASIVFSRLFSACWGQPSARSARTFDLSLALARRVVELHRGQIECDAENGSSAALVIFLPASG